MPAAGVRVAGGCSCSPPASRAGLRHGRSRHTPAGVTGWQLGFCSLASPGKAALSPHVPPGPGGADRWLQPGGKSICGAPGSAAPWGSPEGRNTCTRSWKSQGEPSEGASLRARTPQATAAGCSTPRSAAAQLEFIFPSPVPALLLAWQGRCRRIDFFPGHGARCERASECTSAAKFLVNTSLIRPASAGLRPCPRRGPPGSWQGRGSSLRGAAATPGRRFCTALASVV